MTDSGAEYEPGGLRSGLIETENFAVDDKGDRLKVYEKKRDQAGGKEYFVKVGVLHREVYSDEQ